MQPDALEIQWTWGKVLSLLGGMGLLAVGIVLPLLGPAGRLTAHAWPWNGLTFLGVWGLGCGISGLAWRRCAREKAKNVAVSLWPARIWVLCYAFLLLLVGLEQFKT